MTSNSKGFVHLFLLMPIIILAIGLAVYLAFKNITLSPTNSLSPTPINKAATYQDNNPSVTPYPTNSIKINKNSNTLINNLYNYSFDYPNDWTLISQKDSGGTVFIGQPGDISIYPPGEDIGSPYSRSIDITTLEVGNKIRYYNIVTEEDFNEWITKSPDENQNQQYYKLKNLVVGSLSAVQFVYQSRGSGSDPYYSIVTAFIRDGKRYFIESGVNESDVNKNMNTYNQILSTFKFLDQPTIEKVTKVSNEIPEELQCANDIDCGINFCAGCKPMNKEYIETENGICTVACTNTPVCYQGICVSKGLENSNYLQITN